MFVNLEITLRPVIAFGMQPYSLRSFRSARLENEKVSIPQKEKPALLSPSGYSQAERPSFGPASPQWGHKSQAATFAKIVDGLETRPTKFQAQG
jgi:hypothetical protein